MPSQLFLLCLFHLFIFSPTPIISGSFASLWCMAPLKWFRARKPGTKAWLWVEFPVLVSEFRSYPIHTAWYLALNHLLVVQFMCLFYAKLVTGKPPFPPRESCAHDFNKPSSAASQLEGSAHWITTPLLQHSITSDSSLERSSWFDKFLWK